MTKYLYLDTNVFLQCKPLHELSWKDAAETEPVVLVVCCTVAAELDKHKMSPSRRIKERARKALQLLATVSEAADFRLDLPQADGVEVMMAGAVRIDWGALDHLDPDTSDDRIIAEILSATHLPPEDVLFVGHDVGACVRARQSGVSAFRVPDDWLLAPEPDPKDKKIKGLEDQVAALRATYASLDVDLVDHAEQVTVREAELPTTEEKERFVESVERCNPHMNDASLMGLWVGQFHDEGAIEEFSEAIFRRMADGYARQYEEWLEDVRQKFHLAVRGHWIQARSFAIDVRLRNLGNRPAEALRMELMSEDAYIIDELPDIPNVPLPPAPPQPVSIYDLVGSDTPPSTLRMPPHYADIAGTEMRDPNAFYFVGEAPDDIGSKIELRCDEFRHQEDDRHFTFRLMRRVENPAETITLRVRVSARNLPEPIDKRWTFAVQADPLDWRDLLPEDWRPRKL